MSKRSNITVFINNYQLRNQTFKDITTPYKRTINQDEPVKLKNKRLLRQVKKRRLDEKYLEKKTNVSNAAFAVGVIGSKVTNHDICLMDELRYKLDNELNDKFRDELRDKLRKKICNEFCEELCKEIQKKYDKLENEISAIQKEIDHQNLLFNDPETISLFCLRQALEIISEANSSDPENFKKICKELNIDSQEILRECKPSNSQELQEETKMNAYQRLSNAIAHPNFDKIHKILSAEKTKKVPKKLKDRTLIAKIAKSMAKERI